MKLCFLGGGKAGEKLQENHGGERKKYDFHGAHMIAKSFAHPAAMITYDLPLGWISETSGRSSLSEISR